MALITNNISGSISDSWRIGITGSVKFGNPGGDNNQLHIPDFPGTDVSFFVSGSRGGKGGVNRTVAVFGGDAVISGSLTVGTGSITITSNEIQFGNGAARIFSGSGGLTFVDSSGGTKTLASLSSGGGGDSFFSSTTTDAIFTTGSVAIRGSESAVDSPSDKGTDVFFYVSGSQDGTKSALFGGNLILSGNLQTRDSGGFNTITLGKSTGLISGSGDLLAGGNLTVAGTSTLVGVVSASGDLAVNGGDITTTATTFNLVNSTASTVNFAGAATALTMGAGTGTTTVQNNLVVTGDLTVNGTTVTVDATTVSIEDPVIGLGFTSGSATRGSPGDRGFIGGLDGENNVAFIWDESADGFAVIRTPNSTTSSLPVDVAGYSTFRAGKVELGGTSAFITSSNGSILNVNAATSNPVRFSFGGTDFAEILESGVDAKIGAVGSKNLILSGTSITMVAGTNGTIFQRDTSTVGSITGAGSTSMTLAARTAASAATSLVLTGSGVTLGANSAVTEFWFANAPRGLASSTDGFTLGSQAGVNLNLSGSSNFLMRHGSTGVEFQQHGSPYIAIKSGSTGLSGNTAQVVSDYGKAMLFGGTSSTIISGSGVFLDAGSAGVTVRKDSSAIVSIISDAANTLTLSPGAGFTTANILNTIATTVNLAGAGTNINVGSFGSGNLYLKNAATNISGSLTVAGTANLNGAVNLGNETGDDISFIGLVSTNLLPKGDKAQDLGGPSNRWANIYTGDLHLRNERGNWTIIEESDFLTITNNLNGKRYKFVMEEI